MDYNFVHTQTDKKYEKIYSAAQKFSTLYATKNIKEDFAETFKDSVQYCLNLSRIPEDRRDYLRRKVTPYFPECDVS
jgi:hypothetical protein